MRSRTVTVATVSLVLLAGLFVAWYAAFGGAGEVFAQSGSGNDTTNEHIPMGRHGCTAHLDRIHRSAQVGVISVHSRTTCTEQVNTMTTFNDLYRYNWLEFQVTHIASSPVDTVVWLNSASEANANARGAPFECLGTGNKKYRASSTHIVYPTSGTPFATAARVSDRITCPDSATDWSSGIG